MSPWGPFLLKPPHVNAVTGSGHSMVNKTELCVLVVLSFYIGVLQSKGYDGKGLV